MANNNSNLIEKLLGGSGLNQVWVKVFSLVKILTGDVDVKNKGNLQKQIDDVRSDVGGIMDGTGDTGLVFADDTESEYDTAIGQVVSGKPLSVLFQYLKAALKSAYTLAQKAYNVAAGKNQARVFATVGALDEWLGDPDNLAQLHVGDNFYIVALDVPDYWWDGEQKQPLETQKVDMTTYDQAIAALQSADTKLNGDIATHKTSSDHDGRYYTETEVDNLLNGKAPLNHNHDNRYYTETEINEKLRNIIYLKPYTNNGGNTAFTERPSEWLNEVSGIGLRIDCILANNSDKTTYAPQKGQYPQWYNVITFGTGNRTTQIAATCFSTTGGRNKLYMRTQHDTTVTGWENIEISNPQSKT